MDKIGSTAGKVLASSVVGGTASVLGGGKFANGAVTGSFVMLFNHMSHPKRNGVTFKEAKMMAKLYKQYQLGKNEPFTVDAESLGLSEYSREQLGLPENPEIGNVYQVDLFKTGVNGCSVSFGTIDMRYLGNNQFSIDDNMFNFEYLKNGTFKRNAETFVGNLAVFGRIFDYPVPIPHPHFLQPSVFWGGPFNVKFNGTITIK